jgi:predicted phosphoribosyltransferase
VRQPKKYKNQKLLNANQLMGNLRIISHSAYEFRDRKEAARMLGKELIDYHGTNPVVLGILRGGIVVADELSDILDGELDIVLSRKLGAPYNPELAIGAVNEHGELFLNKEIMNYINADSIYVQKEKKRQMEEINRRIKKYRTILPKINLENRIVIVTDDGVATGATMQAALWAIRQETPERLIAALPVGPMDSIERLSKDADELICLSVPSYFAAVGQFYINFEQVNDSKVMEIIEENAQKKVEK